MPGYPDWQKIQQWLGAPLAQATGAAIGAGTVVLGPFNLASWASLVVSLKPTGGNVTLTVSQKISGGPSTLELDTQFVVAAGTTVFEAVVLFGDAVTVTLQGTTVGETVDYAVYPSNTTTNAQVLASAVINVQKAGVLVAAEPTLNFLDGLGVRVSAVDDPTNTRVGITIAQVALAQAILAAPASAIDFQNIPQTYVDLLASLSARGTQATVTAGHGLRINNDSAADYWTMGYFSNGVAIAYFSDWGTTFGHCGYMPGASSFTNAFGSTIVEIQDYADATKEKTWLVDSYNGGSITQADIIKVDLGGYWHVGSTNGINRLTFVPSVSSFETRSRVLLSARPGP